jgi:antitoxin MazE
MSSGTAVAKWGNSIGVRIPKAVADQAGLHEGDTVQIEAEGPGVIVVRAVKGGLTLEDLVSRITAKNRHAETEWGPSRDNEVW